MDPPFFFQAEDGIRDVAVTGVQTCALPISGAMAGLLARRRLLRQPRVRWRWRRPFLPHGAVAEGRSGEARLAVRRPRSEERRVGKECRARGSPEQDTKKSNSVVVGLGGCVQ